MSKKPLTRLDRGGPVTRLAAGYLKDPAMDEATIATRIRKRLGTDTSARSVASIASRLRQGGFNVPLRA